MRFPVIAFGAVLCYAAPVLAAVDPQTSAVEKKTYVCDCPCACNGEAAAVSEDPRLGIGKMIARQRKKINAGFDASDPYLRRYGAIKDARLLPDYLAELDREQRAIVLLYAALNSRIPHIQKLLLYVADKDVINDAFMLMLSRQDEQFYFETAIKGFVKAGGDVNNRDQETGLTPLMVLATATKQTEPLKFLLKKGAKLNAQNETGMTPLMYAARYSAYPEVVEFLLKAGADMKRMDVQGKNALEHLHANIAMPKDPSYDRLRLALGEKITAQVAVKSDEFYNAMMNGDIAAAEKGLNTIDVNMKNADGETLLIQAFSSKKPIEATRLLIRGGADVNATDNNGNTVLMTALKKVKNKDLIHLLLHEGADVNARNKNGDTPLKNAFIFDQGADVVSMLLNAGADKQAADKNGQAPLDYARERAFVSGSDAYNDIIALLEKDETATRIAEKTKKDTLASALKDGNPAAVRSALKGTDVNKRDADGSTPFLDALASPGNNTISLIRPFIEAGADLEQRHVNGSTPLMHAVRHGASPDVVALLTYAGVPTDTKDRNGRTALDYVENSRTYSPDDMRDLTMLLSPETVVTDADVSDTTPPETETFLKLVLNGTDQEILSALKRGANPNMTDAEGNSPLMFLLRTLTDEKTVKRLLKTGTDVNLANKKGMMPLTYALKRRQNPDVIFLLMRAGAVENLSSTEKAANARTLRRMLASGKKVTEQSLPDFFAKGIIPDDELIRKKTVVTKQSFIDDILYLSVDKIAKVLPDTVDPNFVYPNGKTPLMLAVSRWYQPLEAAKVIVEKGARVDTRDKNEETALFYAVKNNDLNMAKWLISQKADVNTFNKDGLTPLVFALSDKKMEKLLTDNKADINIFDAKGNSLLENALPFPALFEALLKSGANVNAQDDAGESVLLIAAPDANNAATVQMALTAGADVNLRNYKGETALMKAVVAQKKTEDTDTAVIDLLIKAGANVDLRDNYGKTALMRAVDETSSTPAIKALLAAGADVTMIDNANQSAFDYAQKNTSLNLEDDYGFILKALQNKEKK